MFEATKPLKPKNDLDFDPDIFGDILGNTDDEFPVAGLDDEPEDEIPGDPEDPAGMDALKRSSSANTRAKVGAINPTDQMRDYMSRIAPDAGGDEGDIPEPRPPGEEVVLRTARDVPAVVSNAMRATGFVTPEWHSITDLPGYGNRNIRGMGRGVFGLFTSTPLEDIITMANVGGQGPNTDAEMRAVANWLRNNAEDMGEVKLSHGMAIPGYEPDVREFSKNGVRFHVVRDPMGQYIYAYPDADARTPAGGGEPPALPGMNRPPRLREEMIKIDKPTLFESLKWDEEIFETFIEESSLSKLLGKKKGGQNLVRWLHRRHRLSNDADFTPAPFNKEILWSQFKSNPDDFVIVSAENGVAGIKPNEKFIKDRTAEKAKKGQVYNPGGDGTVPYQIIAFTDDGQQVDPELLKPVDPKDRHDDPRDPTVTKARMGKHTGRETQNPDNVFNLLTDQIGRLQTVWKSGFHGYRADPDSIRPAVGSVERDKLAKRQGYKTGHMKADPEALKAIMMRVKPVLKKLGDQAYSQILRTAKRYTDGGNFEAGQKVMKAGQQLKNFLITLDTPNGINMNAGYNSPTKDFTNAITNAVKKASGAEPETPEFNEWMNDAIRGNTAAMKPILDALREVLVNISPNQ